MAPPKGHPRYGGRRKGTPNRDFVAINEAGRALAVQVLGANADELEPFEYLQLLYRDRRQPDTLRAQWAMALLPYTRPKLSAVVSVRKDVEGDDEAFGRLFQQIEQRLALQPPAAREMVIDMLKEGDDEC